MTNREWKADPRTLALQESRCYDLLRTARDLKARAIAAEAQAASIARSWDISLDKVRERL